MAITAAVETDGRRHRPAKELTPFGKMLTKLRADRGISQSELARRAGCSGGYIGLIETGGRGQKPSLDFVRKVAQVLATDVDETEKLMRSAGHLGPRERIVGEGRPTFAAFVSSEPMLTRRQKNLLISIYESYFKV